MQMVGHHLQSHYRDFGMVMGAVPPLLLHFEAKVRKPDSGSFWTVSRCVALSDYLTKKLPTPLCHHGNHIHLAVGVVVPYRTAEHGGFLLASKRLLFPESFFVHGLSFFCCFGCRFCLLR